MSLLGDLTFFFRLQVHQTKDVIFISKNKYLKDILRKFWMEDCKLVYTHMVIGCNLNKDNDSLVVNQFECCYIIGS